MKETVSRAFEPYIRILSLVLATWTSLGLVPGALARSHRARNQPVLRVAIYNYAHVGRAGLREAEGQAAALFALADVRIVWLHCMQKGRLVRSQAKMARADCFLRILSASMAKRCNYKRGVMGESVIPLGSKGPLPGGIANVFYGRVRNFSAEWGMFPGDVLGDAIAHELGHLLLGPQHSRKGIMKPAWTSRDGDLASQGKLRFSPEQAAAIRRAARSLQRNRPVRLKVKC